MEEQARCARAESSPLGEQKRCIVWEAHPWGNKQQVFPWGNKQVSPWGNKQGVPCGKRTPGGIASLPLGEQARYARAKKVPMGEKARCTRAEKVPLGEQVKVHRAGERPRYPYIRMNPVLDRWVSPAAAHRLPHCPNGVSFPLSPTTGVCGHIFILLWSVSPLYPEQQRAKRSSREARRQASRLGARRVKRSRRRMRVKCLSYAFLEKLQTVTRPNASRDNIRPILTVFALCQYTSNVSRPNPNTRHQLEC